MKVLITSECNLNCTHCFRSFDKHQYYLPNEKLIEIVDYAIATSCNSISFSGGEFFMHPFAYDLLDYCYKKELPVKVLTNATLIDDISFFKKYKGKDLLSFQVSLDGMKENHDRRRGPGVFDLVIRNVKALKSLGLHVTVSMTIDPNNMYDVLDVLSLDCFDDFNFLPVAFAGEKTKEGRPVLDDEYREYEDIIKTIYTSSNNILNENYRCRMFPYQLGFNYDGGVYPCAVARDYGLFCLGNILDAPIESIVKNYLKSNKSHELLSYTNNCIDECNDCLSKEQCSRGCRIRAYKFFGRLSAPDPFCCKLFGKDYSDIPINCIFWGEK